MRVKNTNIFGILLVCILFLSLQNVSLYIQGKDSSFEEQNMEAQVDYSIIGQYDDNYGVPKETVIQDSKAYIASIDGLLILDVSSPNLPEHLGFFNSAGEVNDVAIKDGFAFLATTDVGLEVVNITDPTNPFLHNVCSINEQLEGLYLELGTAYLACEKIDLIIVNITDLSNMHVLGIYDDPNDNPVDPFLFIDGRSHDVYARDGYAIIADGEDGLNIINVLDPENPTLVMKHVDSPETYDFQIVDNLLYTTNEYFGFSIFNISSMSSPDFLSIYHYDVHNNWGRDIYVENDIAYIAQSGNNYTHYDDVIGGLELVKISDPNNPIHINKILLYKNFYKVIFYEGFVLLNEGNYDFRIVDPQDIISPTKGYYRFGGYANKVSVRNNHAFLFEDKNGLEIIDVSTPSAPEETAQVNFDYYLSSLSLTDDYLFITVYDPYEGDKVLTFDINDVNNPFIKEYHTDIFAYKMLADSSEIYISRSEFTSYEITSPYNLVPIDNLPIYGQFVISGDDVYLMSNSGELNIVDITNPNDLQIQSTTPTISITGIPKDIVYGNNLIAYLDSDIKIIDVSDKQNPILVSTIEDLNYCYNIGIYQKYLFVVDSDFIQGKDILTIYDLDDPSNPTEVLTINAPNIYDFYFDGELLYTANGMNGLQIIEINGLDLATSPVEINTTFTVLVFGPILLIISWITRIRKSKKR